jgi:hypothetical protein
MRNGWIASSSVVIMLCMLCRPRPTAAGILAPDPTVDRHSRHAGRPTVIRCTDLPRRHKGLLRAFEGIKANVVVHAATALRKPPMTHKAYSVLTTCGWPGPRT